MSFWCLQFFQKKNKNNSTWGIIVVGSNFFIRFLEELRIPKSPFEINWPLWSIFGVQVLIQFGKIGMELHNLKIFTILYNLLGMHSFCNVGIFILTTLLYQYLAFLYQICRLHCIVICMFLEICCKTRCISNICSV